MKNDIAITKHNTDINDIMNRDDVAEFLSISKTSLYILISLGHIKSYRAIGISSVNSNIEDRVFLKYEVAEYANIDCDDRLIRAKEVAEYLGIGLSTVWLYVKQGLIKPIKLKGLSRVTVFSVKKLNLSINNTKKNANELESLIKDIEKLEKEINQKQKLLIIKKRQKASIDKRKEQSKIRAKLINKLIGKNGYKELEKKFLRIIDGIYLDDIEVEFPSGKNKYKFIKKDFFVDKEIVPLLLQSFGKSIIERIDKLSNKQGMRNHANAMNDFYKKMNKHDIIKLYKEWEERN